MGPVELMQGQASSSRTTVRTEYVAALNHSTWAEVPTGVVTVNGPDRAIWLHKIITAEVENLVPGQGVRAALLDAKGHFSADFVLLVESDAILLLTQPDAASPLMRALRRYIIREKAHLSDSSRNWRLVTIIGPESDAMVQTAFGAVAPQAPFCFARSSDGAGTFRLIRAARARVPATDVLAPVEETAKLEDALSRLPESDAALLEILRMEAGLPEWGADFDPSTLALEIPPVHDVRVDQGCYVGQEVVARLVHRGHVNRRLVGLVFDAPEPPSSRTPLFQKDKEVGFVTSSASSPSFGMIGLGYVRREASEEGTVLQVGEQAHARIVKFPIEE